MAQMSVVFGKPEENLTMMERFLNLAALCHPIPGATSEAYCRLAKQYHLWIAAGLTERAGKKTYNAALLISDSGEICLHHRKINVLTGVEDVYEIGDRLGVADTPFGRVALDICADNAESSMVLGEAFARIFYCHRAPGALPRTETCSGTFMEQNGTNRIPYFLKNTVWLLSE